MAPSESVAGKAGDVPPLTSKIAGLQNVKEYAELNWSGTFEDYLSLIKKNPSVTRTAFQRVYDMILSYGQEEYIDNKKRLIRFNFFKDDQHGGRDAIFGLDIPLMRLVSVLQSAAQRYGTERRVILLHGPVGSSKSTIARLIKRGLEEYSRTPEGSMYTFDWVLPEALATVAGGQREFKCPMHEEPLRLIPLEWRDKALVELGINVPGRQHVHIEGDLDPACRLIFRELMLHHKGNWSEVVKHIRVRRLILSEQDRVGVGTFQPKDEKNQDSTELTGDINYRKIAEYGSDSDPRAFNFDGEFNIANRGIIEFIEVLKLDVAFLYDLLGASQEHKIKPKKFAQTDIDEVIIGPHQRARIQEAPEQRVHGGPARSDGQDRRALRHAALRRGADLREGLQRRQDPRQAHRAAHPGDGRDVGGADPPGGAQEAPADAAAEDEAVRREDLARLHRGQHQGAPQGGGAGGDGRDLAPVHPGQDLQRPGQ